MPAASIYSLGENGLFLVKSAAALITVALATITAVAAGKYFYNAHPLTESNLIFMLQ